MSSVCSATCGMVRQEEINMALETKSLLDAVCDSIAERLNADTVATAKMRQADAIAGRSADYIPMTFAVPVPEAADMPEFNWAEQFHDPAKSLFMQLKNDVLRHVATDSDFVPAVRADTGVVNCTSVFGAEYTVPEHTKPAITKHISKQVVAEFQLPEDISSLGVMPNMIEHMQHHSDVLRDHGLDELVTVHHCDQQGPFDIAALARGHEILLDLHDDPAFVHDLMQKSTDIYVAVSKLCKSINGEPLSGGNVSGYWMDNGGVRMCGDSDILVSAELFSEFIQPYQQQAFAVFGGGWLHYCGGSAGYNRLEGLHLHELYAQIDGLRGLNWTTAGDWLGEMRKLKELGVVHLGTVPRGDDESLEEYFRKALSPYDARNGMVFNAEIKPEEAGLAMELWHKVQDEVLA